MEDNKKLLSPSPPGASGKVKEEKSGADKWFVEGEGELPDLGPDPENLISAKHKRKNLLNKTIYGLVGAVVALTIAVGVKLVYNSGLERALTSFPVSEPQVVYVNNPCDENQECRGYKERVGELELALAHQKPAPIEMGQPKAVLPSSDIISYSDALSSLKQDLDLAPVVFALEGVPVKESPAVSPVVYLENVLWEANLKEQSCAPPLQGDWYSRFNHAWNKEDFRRIFHTYVKERGVKQVLADFKRGNPFKVIGAEYEKDPDYLIKSRLFDEKVFQYLGTTPTKIRECIIESICTP